VNESGEIIAVLSAENRGRGADRLFVAVHDLQSIQHEVGGVAQLRAPEIFRNLAETCLGAIGEHRVHRDDIVAHPAMTQAAPSDRIRRRHPADGRLVRRGDIDGQPDAVRQQCAVERRQRHPRFHDAGPGVGVVVEQTGQILGEIQDQALADRLTGLARAAASRRDRNPFLECDGDRRSYVVLIFWQNDAHRKGLIGRSVRSVSRTIEVSEKHVTRNFAAEASGEVGTGCSGVAHAAVLVRRFPLSQLLKPRGFRVAAQGFAGVHEARGWR
jgi:hypothetical protein